MNLIGLFINKEGDWCSTWNNPIICFIHGTMVPRETLPKLIVLPL